MTERDCYDIVVPRLSTQQPKTVSLVATWFRMLIPKTVFRFPSTAREPVV